MAQTLGIAKSATVDDIRRAYRRLLTREHPDKGGDAEKFDGLQNAFRDACKAAQRKLGGEVSGNEKQASKQTNIHLRIMSIIINRLSCLVILFVLVDEPVEDSFVDSFRGGRFRSQTKPEETADDKVVAFNKPSTEVGDCGQSVWWITCRHVFYLYT